MSGSNLAYHLRPNKAIDRNLFIAILERVGRVRNISGYEYIGFGGPMLEDYKALHAALRISRMHSIERDENTYRRQRFNRPASFVTLHNLHSDEFFRQHEFHEGGSVVWLDYTDSQLRSQLDEFASVVSKLDCYDVVKVTLNANPANLGSEELKAHERPQARIATLMDRIGSYAPPDLVAADMEAPRYPRTLQRCVKNAVGHLAARAGGRYFQILSSFVYADGQQMLTITGIVFKSPALAACADFMQRARLKSWPFANLDWLPPKQIAVPALTAKERMHLDGVLPFQRGDDAAWQARLKRRLGYSCGSSTEDLAHYARYYRAYPHFSRIVL